MQKFPRGAYPQIPLEIMCLCTWKKVFAPPPLGNVLNEGLHGGAANRHSQQNTVFAIFVDLTKQHNGINFSMISMFTSRLDANISRSGDFRTDISNRQQTNRLPYHSSLIKNSLHHLAARCSAHMCSGLCPLRRMHLYDHPCHRSRKLAYMRINTSTQKTSNMD